MWEKQPLTLTDNRYRWRCGTSGVLCILVIFFTLVTIVGIGIFASERVKKDNYLPTTCMVMSSQLLQYTCEQSDTTTTRAPPYPTTSGWPPYPTTSRRPTPSSSRLVTYPTSAETVTNRTIGDLQRLIPCWSPRWDVQYNDLTAPVVSIFRYSSIYDNTRYTYYYTAQNELNRYLVSIRCQLLHLFLCTIVNCLQVGRSYTCYFDKNSPSSVQWFPPNPLAGLVLLIIGAVLLAITIIVLVVRQIRIRCINTSQTSYMSNAFSL